ncbi:DUF5989 family protein [Cohaesibacter celericrescens]
MEFISDLWAFARTRKKFWLFPLVLAMIVVGLLIVLVQSSALMSSMYVLF